MKYSKIKISGTSVRVALFDKNRKEAHAIISCDPDCDAKSQIKNLTFAIQELGVRLDMKPVFKRYILSDATNQHDMICYQSRNLAPYL